MAAGTALNISSVSFGVITAVLLLCALLLCALLPWCRAGFRNLVLEPARAAPNTPLTAEPAMPEPIHEPNPGTP